MNGAPNVCEHVFAASLPRLREAEVTQLDALRPTRVQQRVVQLQIPDRQHSLVSTCPLDGSVCKRNIACGQTYCTAFDHSSFGSNRGQKLRNGELIQT